MSLCLSVCLSAFLPICLSAYMSLFPYVSLPTCLSACLSVSLGRGLGATVDVVATAAGNTEDISQLLGGHLSLSSQARETAVKKLQQSTTPGSSSETEFVDPYMGHFMVGIGFQRGYVLLYLVTSGLGLWVEGFAVVSMDATHPEFEFLTHRVHDVCRPTQRTLPSRVPITCLSMDICLAQTRRRTMLAVMSGYVCLGLILLLVPSCCQACRPRSPDRFLCPLNNDNPTT